VKHVTGIGAIVIVSLPIAFLIIYPCLHVHRIPGSRIPRVLASPRIPHISPHHAMPARPLPQPQQNTIVPSIPMPDLSAS